MGRPLNKKYFGNRNVGTLSTTADNGIGGGALGSVSNGTVGAIQINNTYKTFPDLTVAAPLLPGGVTADLTVTWEVATVSLSGGTGYTAGTITSITGLDSYADTDTRFTVTETGGVPTFGAFTERGSYTSIDGTGITTWAVVGPGGTGAQATVTFRVKSIAVTNQGSGYTTTPALTWSQTNGGTMPSAQTVTMLVDDGLVGTAGNQENAIVMYANVGNGSGKVDVIRQVSTRRYKVTDGTTTDIVELGTDGTPETGEAYLIATDANGNTYYVTKLTAHMATLSRLTDDGSDDDWVYATNQSAPWSFDSATGVYVQIENA